MEFSRQAYWSRWPFLPLGDLPDPGIDPRSPAMQVNSLPSEPPGKPTIVRGSSMSYVEEYIQNIIEIIHEMEMTDIHM